jgi:hypothetical protein
VDGQVADDLALGLRDEVTGFVGLEPVEKPLPAKLSVDWRLGEDVTPLGRDGLEQTQDPLGVLGTRPAHLERGHDEVRRRAKTGTAAIFVSSRWCQRIPGGRFRALVSTTSSGVTTTSTRKSCSVSGSSSSSSCSG